MRMRRLRINWINPRPNLAGGMKSNRLIAEAMVRRGHEVRIVYVSAARPWPAWTHPRMVLRRIAAEARALGRQRHHLESSIATLIPVNHAPIRAEDIPDADVTIGTWWETMEWVSMWPTSKGVKAYFVRHHELHGGDPERVRATYRSPCLKLVIARWLEKLMRETYGSRDVVLVPNGVDWTQFGSPPREKPQRPTVGMLYGTPSWKGALTAFAALRLVAAQVPNLRVMAFGREPLKHEHRPPPGLEFYFRPRQALIPDLYRAATCWLVASQIEGFGMPGLEAAACRCPIVATRSGGPEDYVDDRVSGRLVNVDVPREMADAILEILGASTDEWRHMSHSSFAIAQRFTWEKSAEILEAALINAVENQPA